MPVPEFQTFMLPVLEIHRDGAVHHLPDHYDAIAKHLNIADEDRREMLASGRQSKFENRIGWARTFLKKAGLLEFPSRGMNKITERGLTVLNQKPTRVDNKFLSQFPEFVEFRKVTRTPVIVKTPPITQPRHPKKFWKKGIPEFGRHLFRIFWSGSKAALPAFSNDLWSSFS